MAVSFLSPLCSMPGKRITLKDIAREAGVSIGTVDRVIHERGEVASATKQRILELADKMKYSPNIFARALTSSKHDHHIVVLLPKANEENIYWAAHENGVQQQIKQLEAYSVQLSIAHFELHSPEDFTRKCNQIADEHPDGVIFAPIFKKQSQDFASLLDQRAIPYIFIDTFIDGTNCLGFVGEDAFQSGRMAASIIDFGTPADKDILLVNLSKDLENTQHLTSRNQGFLSYFMDEGRNNGMRISVEIPSTENEKIDEKLSPIFASNDNIGAVWFSGAKTYLIAKFLERINRRDVILVGYDIYGHNIDYLRRNYINFLIAQQPLEQAAKAVNSMFRYLVEHAQPMKLEYQKVEIVNSENIRFFIQ